MKTYIIYSLLSIQKNVSPHTQKNTAIYGGILSCLQKILLEEIIRIHPLHRKQH